MPNPRAFWLCLAGQIILAVSTASAQNDVTRFETKVLPVLAKNCFPCHGADVQTADVNFSVFHDGRNAAEKPDLWRKVRDKIRNHLMPPPPIPGLSAADADAVTGWIDSIAGAPETIFAAPNPGRVTARRLNRVEYNNTIRDFLGVSVRPADDFPIDNQGYGFDNIGDVLTLSPMLMEKYMAAARSVSRIAVYGETYEKKPRLIGKLLPKSVQDDGLVSGNTLPFSIRGDLEGVYRFPVEGDYVLQFRITNRRGSSPPAALSPAAVGRATASGGRGGAAGASDARGGRGATGPGRGVLTLTDEDKKALLEANRKAAPPVELDIDVDGRQVLKDTVEGNDAYTYTHGPTVVRVHVTAGEHTIHAYFPANANLDDPRANLNRDGRHKLSAEFLEIIGPYNPSPAKPASYTKIFTFADHNAACTRKILESLERRGFRRPPAEAETQRLLKLVALVQKQGDSFDEGIRIALQSILVCLSFLFRIERDPANTTATYRVSDYELASRLSYFLWSSMPDDQLLALAAQHRLSDRAVMEAQVKRMLQDPKASNLVTDFATQWLDLRALDRKKPDALKFPTVDDELLADMRHETMLFVSEIFMQDHSLLDLIDGKFTYVNGPLARYYGIRGVDGTAFQRVSLEGTERGGILTQASILTLTSFATRTSLTNNSRQVGFGQHSRSGSPATAAQHSGARRKESRDGRFGTHPARTAPRESRVRRLPQTNGSNWLRDGEFRRGRRLANQRR